MSADFKQLAVQLDAVVRNVPGVTALYSAAPSILTSVRQLALGADAAHLVAITSTPEGWQIVASIGVDSSTQGPQTAAAVSAAILDALPPGTEATVHVRVSRILG